MSDMIPLLKYRELKETSLNSWTLLSDSGKYFRMNSTSAKCSMVLNQSSSWSEAALTFSRVFDRKIAEDEARSIGNTIISSIEGTSEDLIHPNGGDRRKRKWFSVNAIILSEQSVVLLAHRFVFLFKPKIFWPMFMFSLVGSLYGASVLLSSASSRSVVSLAQSTGVFVLLSCVFFMHELGHSSATLSLDRKPGPIGFGLYLGLPVLYSDVSDVWFCTAADRIRVNLAGIYVEFISVSILFIVGLIANSTLLSYAALTILTSAALQLIPFFRRDGYWLLADFFDHPNLAENSFDELFRLVRRPTANGPNMCLVLYALLGIFFLAGAILYIAIFYGDDIVNDLFALRSLLLSGRLFSLSEVSVNFVGILRITVLIAVIIQSLRFLGIVLSKSNPYRMR